MKHKWYFLIIVICLKFVITFSKAVRTNETENESLQEGGLNVLTGKMLVNYDLEKQLNDDVRSIDERLLINDDNGTDKNQFTGIDPSTYEDLDFIQNQPVITSPPYIGYETYEKEIEEEQKQNQILFDNHYLWNSIYIFIGVLILKIFLFFVYTRRRQVVTLTRTTIYRPPTISPPSRTHRPSQPEVLSGADDPPLYEDVVVNVPQNIPLVKK